MLNSDRPIQNKSEDRLDRSRFVTNFVRTVISNRTKDPLCIALTGKWGCGKSSILKMFAEEFEVQRYNISNPPILIDFNPWNISGTDQLIEQFFLRMANKLSTNDVDSTKKLGDILLKYSGAITLASYVFVPEATPAIKEKIKLIIETTGKILKGGDSDLQSQKEKLTNIFSALDHRIIVIIDEIDRLSNDQIRTVFQLVNAIAQFPNVTYILSFDKDVVVKALKKVQEGDGNEYLDKVIQYEQPVPDITKEQLQVIFLENMDILAKEFNIQEIDIDYVKRMLIPNIPLLMNNIRDINKTSNALSFYLTSICNNINIVDMILICIIQKNYPELHDWIRENKLLLVGGFSKHVMKSQQELKELYLKELQSIEPRCDDKVFTLLSNLFPAFGYLVGLGSERFDKSYLFRNDRIASEHCFLRYFDLSVDNEHILRSEMEHALYFMTKEQLIDYLIEITGNGYDKIYDFTSNISLFMEDLNVNRAKIVASALFETSYLFPTKSGFFTLSPFVHSGDAIRKLIDKLPVADRFIYIKEIMDTQNWNSLQIFADFLNTTELAHGRLGANGNERGFEKLISEDELISIEEEYVKWVKNMEPDHNLLLAQNYRMIIYLMSEFDTDHTTKYLRDLFSQDDKNKLLCLRYWMSTWNGSGTEYVLSLRKGKLDSMTSKDEMLDAINNLRDSGRYFELPEDAQIAGAVLWIYVENDLKMEADVEKKEVDELLKKWKNEQ